jgi:hypothetical protein
MRLDEVTACRSVLIEVLTILGKDLDKRAVVGGWVPELPFPHKGHAGSLDVDLALDPRKLKPLAYESIRKKLVDSAYRQDPNVPNRFRRRGKRTGSRQGLLSGSPPARGWRRSPAPSGRFPGRGAANLGVDISSERWKMAV